jgi:hypothetical protein
MRFCVCLMLVALVFDNLIQANEGSERTLIKLPESVPSEAIFPLKIKSKAYTLRLHPLTSELTNNAFWLIKDSDFDSTTAKIKSYGVAVAIEKKEQWEEFYFGFLEQGDDIQLYSMVNGTKNKCLIGSDINSKGNMSLYMFFEYGGRLYSVIGDEWRIKESLDIECHNQE